MEEIQSYPLRPFATRKARNITSEVQQVAHLGSVTISRHGIKDEPDGLAKNVGRHGRNRAIRVSIHPTPPTSKKRGQETYSPPSRSGVQMPPSPPVLQQDVAFSPHFSAVAHRCCRIYGPGHVGRSLPFTPLASMPREHPSIGSGKVLKRCSHFAQKDNQYLIRGRGGRFSAIHSDLSDSCGLSTEPCPAPIRRS